MDQQPPPAGDMNAESTEKSDTEVCDVLCSLGNGGNCGGGEVAEIQPMPSAAVTATAAAAIKPKTSATRACPKQHQLPMFLSKTYHMIDRCDPEIATWSLAGDNFVVKNVEQFASNVLPLYFKHSNFSSFARQLNFYGFRKLRSDPILTSDVDPRTACYVRFYHDKFQKDRPELLHQIKRATKSDMQSKDDVESLKLEVNKLNECIANMSSTMDRKLAEMSYEYNRRITSLTAEYDKLAVLVTQILANQQHQQQHGTNPAAPQGTIQLPNPPPPPPQQQQQHAAPPPIPGAIGSSLMHSLSQVAAISLQNHHLQPPQISVTATTTNETGGAANNKRSASEDVSGTAPQKQKSS